MSDSPLSKLTAGTYSITSVASLTTLQVCCSDEWSTTNRGEVRAFPTNGREDQLWTFIPHRNDTLAIQSLVQSEDKMPLYLSPSTSQPRWQKGRLALTVGTLPFGWNIKHSHNRFQIYWPGTGRVLDIHWGRKYPNTPVHLNGRHNGCERQYWCCIPRSPPPAPREWHATQSQSIKKPLVIASSTPKALLNIQNLPPWALSPKPYILQSGGSWDHALDVHMGGLGLVRWKLHGHLNQQWCFIRNGEGYAIKSMWTPALDSRPLYLTVEGIPRVYARVVLSHYPVAWSPVPSDMDTDTMAIFWPGSNLVLSLVNQKVQLAPYESQTWDRLWYHVCA